MLLTLVVSACAAHQEAAHRQELPPGVLPLAIDLRLGDAGDGPASFTDPRGLAVDTLGRIFVLERSGPEIRIFDSAGNPTGKSGRKGEGPGEFLDPIGLTFDPQGILWSVDQGTARVSRFDHEAKFLDGMTRGFSGNNVGWWRGVVDDQGRWIDVLENPGQAQSTTLLRRTPGTAAPPDTASLPSYVIPAFEVARKNSWTRASIPFAPRLLWALDHHGNIWSGVSDQYSLVKRSFAGGTLARARHEYEAPAVTSEERSEAIRNLEWFTKQGGRIDADRIPGYKPLFRELVADDEDRLWVELNSSAALQFVLFDVFSPDGGFLGRVGAPLGNVAYPPLVVRGRLYAVVVDSLGVPQVIRARVPALPQASAGK